MPTCPFLLDLETVLVGIHESGFDLSGPCDRFTQEPLKHNGTLLIGSRLKEVLFSSTSHYGFKMSLKGAGQAAQLVGTVQV